MSGYYLTELQAEYRSKILANGFVLVRISEEEAEDGIGFAGNNYVKNHRCYGFEDALEEMGEYENYRSAIRVKCEELKERSRKHFATRDWSKSSGVVDDIDGEM